MSVKEEELLEEISGFLHGYLKSGKVKINSFLSKINLNITNMEQLLTIRFLLKDETITFVRELPFLLKRFKSTTIMQSELHRGEVKGQIDWGQTIKERLARTYQDKTIFSTTESIRSYNTPENLVIKQLLLILYTILYKDFYIKGFEKAKWFADWQSLKGNVKQAIKKNFYLLRVDDLQVSNRIVQKMLNHRNRLYRDAAKLLLSYRSLISGQYSEDDLKILLRETFIAPDNVDVLFELYWVVQIIRHNTENSQLYLLDGSQNMVASWEKDEHIYKIYHDSTGSEQIQFNIHSSEIENSLHPYLKKKYQSFSKSRELAQSIFGKTKDKYLWHGRPDFIVEVYHKSSEQLVRLFIGEVKNTSRVDYAITGMEELLDYLYLVKDFRGEYLLKEDFPVKGILCVGDVDLNKETGDGLLIVVNRRIGAELKLS